MDFAFFYFLPYSPKLRCYVFLMKNPTVFIFNNFNKDNEAQVQICLETHFQSEFPKNADPKIIKKEVQVLCILYVTWFNFCLHWSVRINSQYFQISNSKFNMDLSSQHAQWYCYFSTVSKCMKVCEHFLQMYTFDTISHVA